MAGKFDQYKTALPEILENSKTKLTEKEVQVPEDFKLDDLPALIAKVEVGSKVEIVVTAPDYEGETLTARKDQKEVTGTVESGTCRIAVDESGIWTVSAPDKKSVQVEVKMQFEGQLKNIKIIGIKITENESDPTQRVTYTDDAIGMKPIEVNLEDGTVNYNNWDKTWIFNKIYPVMLKTDGTIDYRLNPDDQTKKIEGGASDITNISYDGNAMVVVEKFYTKYGMDGDNECIQISDVPQDGFEPIGFIREDGSEADYFCMPMFMGSFDSSSKLRSLSGQDIKFNTSWTNFRTAAQKNGTNYDIETYAMNQILNALYLILFKTCNWREALGEGRTYDNATNNKTGVLANKGGIAFDPTTKATKFLWIEDYVSWPQSGSDIYRWEAGILCKNKENYVRMKPPYSGTDTATYEKVTDHVYSSGYIKKMKADNKYGRTAIDATGAYKSYECCYWNDNSNTSGTVYVSLRGYIYGVAGRTFNNDASYTYSYGGAALSYLPPA